MSNSRRHDEASAAREPRAAPPEHLRAPGLEGEALRLQQLLGNRKVTALIARASLQRDDVPATTLARADPQAEQAKSGQEKTAGYTMKVDGIEDAIELLSFSWSGGGFGGQGPGAKDTPVELSASAKPGKHSQKLMQAVATGQPIAKVVIKRGGTAPMTITLNNVLVTSFQSGGGQGEPVETFSLNAASVEVELSKSSGEKKSDDTGSRGPPEPPPAG